MTPPDPSRIVFVAAPRVSEQHGGRRACGRRETVVLGNPEPVIAPAFGGRRQLGGLPQLGLWIGAVCDQNEVEHRQWYRAGAVRDGGGRPLAAREYAASRLLNRETGAVRVSEHSSWPLLERRQSSADNVHYVKLKPRS
jgi:hypothetical protein